MSPKILVIRPDAIGDVVLMIPMLNTIKKSIPDAQIYPLLSAYTAPLLDPHDAVKEVIIDWKKSGKAKGVIGFLKYMKFIKDQHFDMVIHSYCDPYYTLLTYLAGIPLRIGDQQRLLPALMMNRAVPQYFRHLYVHEVEHNIALLKGIGCPITKVEEMNLHVPNVPLIQLELELSKREAKDKKLIMIHPTTGGGNRPWSLSGYAKLIDLIHTQSNYQVLLTGFGKKDEEVVSDLLSQCQTSPINLVNQTSITELKKVIQRSCLVIGTDTGPTHIAAALKVPVIGITPTKFVKSCRWGPWQTPNKIISHPEHCPYVCNPYECQKQDCIEAISPERVFTGIQSFLSGPLVIDKSRRDWIQHSVTIGVYLSEHSELPRLKKWVRLSSSQSLRVVIICTRRSLFKAIREEAFPVLELVYCPWYQWRSLYQIITRKDINLIQLMPNKARPIWEKIIRNIVATQMYVPPMILPEHININSEKAFFTDIVETLKGNFKTKDQIHPQ